MGREEGSREGGGGRQGKKERKEGICSHPCSSPSGSKPFRLQCDAVFLSAGLHLWVLGALEPQHQKLQSTITRGAARARSREGVGGERDAVSGRMRGWGGGKKDVVGSHALSQLVFAHGE